ncbi:MAG: N-acetylmannosamine-6-phosphate 2-epimerase [Lachnospiraceae bacterium]|jgi:N-acylglucosamine-6-phosphate 2-epimerase|nr:N-acetylmannosamine-6-phosphate 2-epimerase [Lachnospiraceae bacterium]
MHKIVEKLLNGVVISCQAYEDTPLYGSQYMAAMAKSAQMGGADGLRACWPQDIRAVKAACDIPVIGINKKFGDGDPLDEIFITPSFASAKEVIEAGCDILALDCTIRECRPFEELKELLCQIREAYPDVPIMADLATLEEAVKAEETGCVDIISTTLAGYTRNSCEQKTEGPDIELVRQIKKACSLPVNAEGRIWELRDLELVLEAGADLVSIGSAVSRPHLITERFVNYNKKHYSR